MGHLVRQGIRRIFGQQPGREAIGIAWIALALALALASQDQTNDLPGENKIRRVGYPASAFARGALDDQRVVLEVWGFRLAKRTSGFVGGVWAVIFEDEDFSAVYGALGREEIDLLIMNTLDYVEHERENLMEPAFVGVSGNKVGHEFAILVRRDGKIESLGQLQNNIINIETEGVGRMPIVWLDVLLAGHGFPGFDSFFREVRFSAKPSQAVLPVFFGQVPACLTSQRAFRTMAELNPQLEKELAMLEVSPAFLRGEVVFRKNLDPEVKMRVSEALRTLHEDPDGQQILLVLREEMIIPFQQDYTTTVRSLAANYQRFRSSYLVGNSKSKS